MAPYHHFNSYDWQVWCTRRHCTLLPDALKGHGAHAVCGSSLLMARLATCPAFPRVRVAVIDKTEGLMDAYRCGPWVTHGSVCTCGGHVQA